MEENVTTWKRISEDILKDGGTAEMERAIRLFQKQSIRALDRMKDNVDYIHIIISRNV